MTRHRTSRGRVPSQPNHDNPTTAPAEPEPESPPEPEPDPDPDANHLVCVLRDQLRRADSYITSVEKELVESWGVADADDSDEDEDDDVQRRRCRVEDLVEAGKLAVREAQYTSEQLAAELAMQRRGA